MSTATLEHSQRPGLADGSEDHAQAVFDAFDKQYAAAWGEDRGKFWTDRYSPGLAPYANLVNARNARVVELCSGGEALLDVGSGYGDLLYLLRDRYRVLRGLDPSAKSVELATDNLAKRGVRADYRFDQGVAESLPYEDGVFDTVITLDTYEHIEPRFRMEALVEARRVLRDGGQLIIVTPSRRMLRLWLIVDNLLTLRRQVRARRERGTPIQLARLPKRDFCEVFCSKRELLREVRAAGFRITGFERVSFYPAPERGGFLGKYLDGRRADHPTVRRAMRFVRFFERLKFLNQKMLVVATPDRREGAGTGQRAATTKRAAA